MDDLEEIGKGKFRVISSEVKEQVKRDRLAGMTQEAIAQKYGISINTVRKYTGELGRSDRLKVESESDLNKKVSESFLTQHGGKILGYAKKRDAEVIAAGEAVKEYLQGKGIFIDVDKIPADQLIKLLKSPIGEEMDPELKSIVIGSLKNLLDRKGDGGGERMNTREMMEMALLARILPPQEQSGGTDLEKLKAYYDQRFREQEEKIRDLVLEKRFQTLEEMQSANNQSVAEQLTDIDQKLEALKNVPPNPTPEQKKDAIEELEEIGGKVDRIKKALSPFGVFQTQPGNDPYKSPDGTFDYYRFTVDKLDNTVNRVMSAWEKKAPGQKEVAETPAGEPQYRYRQLSPEEYCNILLNKPNRTPEEQLWLENYREHLNRQLAQLQPKPHQLGLQEPQAQPEGQQVSEPPSPKCCLCSQNEIYINGLCEKCWNEKEEQEHKTSIIDKMKLGELELAKDLSSLGF